MGALGLGTSREKALCENPPGGTVPLSAADDRQPGNNWSGDDLCPVACGRCQPSLFQASTQPGSRYNLRCGMDGGMPPPCLARGCRHPCSPSRSVHRELSRSWSARPSRPLASSGFDPSSGPDGRAPTSKTHETAEARTPRAWSWLGRLECVGPSAWGCGLIPRLALTGVGGQARPRVHLRAGQSRLSACAAFGPSLPVHYRVRGCRR